MGFRENLQYLRSSQSMTQEQLAMLLGVSRQSVTKWEAERSYPEMDKLLKLCQIFDCTLDDLVQGDLAAKPLGGTFQARAAALQSCAGAPPQDVCGYDEHMRSFALRIALGVGAVILGPASMLCIASVGEYLGSANLEALGLVPLFAFIVTGVALFLIAAFQHTEFQRNHPYLQDFYTEEDRQETHRLFTWFLVGGLALIFAGVASCAFFDGRGEAVEGMGASLMLAAVAVGVALIVYGGIMLARINIAGYNEGREEALASGELWDGVMYEDVATLRRDYTDEQIRTMLGVTEVTDEEISRARARLERKRRKGKVTGGLCGITMILATIAGLVMLFVPGLQTPYFWLAWAVGGLMCAVCSIAVSAFMAD